MPTPSTCPDENVLSAWALGSSSVEGATGLPAHLEQCAPCREAFALAARASRLADDVTRPSALAAHLLQKADSPVQPGDVLLGKYEVLSVLGAGGMGVVVQARHLTLNALVALKFIRTELAYDPTSCRASAARRARRHG